MKKLNGFKCVVPVLQHLPSLCSLSAFCLVLLPLLLWFHLICCCYLCHSFNGAHLLQANVELQSEHNFGMRVTGRTRGRTGLKVVLRVTDPAAGQLVGNLQELTDEIQIQVRCSICSCLRGSICETHCCTHVFVA